MKGKFYINKVFDVVEIVSDPQPRIENGDTTDMVCVVVKLAYAHEMSIIPSITGSESYRDYKVVDANEPGRKLYNSLDEAILASERMIDEVRSRAS